MARSFDNTLHSIRLGLNWRLASAGEHAVEGNDRSDTALVLVWSGLHVGVAAGYSVGNSELTVDTPDPISVRGAQGVLTVGYDFQLSPRWVTGLFADYAFGEVDGGRFLFPLTLNNQWAIGARLGVLVTPSTLFYASAGYTAADFRATSGPDFSVDTTLSGYFVGLGVEQALAPNLSVKLDYRYSDYQDVRQPFLDDVFVFNNDVHSFRLGVNWRLH